MNLMFQVTRSAPVYDVVIIGSGAGGGTVTKVLADMGINVALLEAGPMLHPEKDFKMLTWPYQVPHRGAMEGGASYFGHGRAFGYFSRTATVATTKPGVQKPHISPSASQKACCTGCSVPSALARPSTVRICLPWTSIASVEQGPT